MNTTNHCPSHTNAHAFPKNTIPRGFRTYGGAVQALFCILALATVSEAATEPVVRMDFETMVSSPLTSTTILYPGHDRPYKRALWWPGWSPATCDVKETCVKCDTYRSQHPESSCLDPLNELITTEEECKRVAEKYIVAEKDSMYFSASLRVPDVSVQMINNHTHFPRGCFYFNDTLWLNKNDSSVVKCHNSNWNKQLTCFCSYPGSCVARAKAMEDYKPAKSGANHTFNVVVVAFISFVATVMFS